MILQTPHVWRGEFERLVNERSVSSTIEVLFRQAADASASLALVHKGLTRNLVENDPGRFLPMPRMGSPGQSAVPLAPIEDEARYFDIYASYASAIIGATAQLHQDVAFFWEYHLGDLEGIKPISPEERTIFPAVKRDAVEIGYERRMHDRWTNFLTDRNISAIDPISALKQSSETVFTDYLHYTAKGNALMADVVYAQLRERLLQRLQRRRGLGTLH